MSGEKRFPTFDTLILLVGGNPLPNYVVARFLQSKRILLVHSVGTAQIAERLKSLLPQEISEEVNFVLVEVEESSAASIHYGLSGELERCYPKPVSIHLHYTGGTKAMAIHAYRVVEEWSQRNRVDWSASYMDARRQTLVFDSPEERSYYVGSEVSLSLKEMLSLHGWSLQHFHEQPVLPTTARQIALSIAQDCRSGKYPSAYQQWVERQLLGFRKENSRNWLSEGQLKQKTLALPVDELPQIASALQGELGTKDTEIRLEQAKAAAKFSKTEDFCKWLEGAWLESYVMHVIQSLPDDVRPQEVFRGVETQEIKFELDVVAVRGYQLILFSCTTAGDRGTLKLKLFEAIMRARQVGGDQARVALVCTHNDPASIQREARERIDPDNQNQIRVFGCSDLGDLDQHSDGPRLKWLIAEWIRS